VVLATQVATNKMDIASYFQVYPHPPVDGGYFLALNITNIGYSILGTVACIGLFILVMAAIIFSAFLYRRRRSAQLLAMRAMLHQQTLPTANQDYAPDIADEPLQPYGLGTYGLEPDEGKSRQPGIEDGFITPMSGQAMQEQQSMVSGQGQQTTQKRPITGAIDANANTNVNTSSNGDGSNSSTDSGSRGNAA
jgi:hypothetical protein